MSQQNVEIVKEFTRRFEQGDREELPRVLRPSRGLGYPRRAKMPAAGVYHGHDGIEEFFRDWLGTWRDF